MEAIMLVRLFLTALMFCASASYAELVGYIPSPFGTIYFINENQSECPNDQQAVFVQRHGTASSNGSPVVHKMPGCWTEKQDGKLLANWPGLGVTEHKKSDLKTMNK